MIVKSVNPENLQKERSLKTDERLKPVPPKSRKLTTANQDKVRRKPGGSSRSRGVQGEQTRSSLAREKNVSEYQDIYKAWPTLPVSRRRPVDCIRPKGNIDLLTNYADVYKGVKGEVAKLTRHPITVGTEAVPFREFSEYQDKYQAWSAPPARSLKPTEYKVRGDIEFVTNYSQEYRAREIKRRLPIIQLDQIALRQGPFQTTTSYQNDFTPGPAMRLPGSSRLKSRELQHLSRRRHLPRSSDAPRERRTAGVPSNREKTQPVRLAVLGKPGARAR